VALLGWDLSGSPASARARAGLGRSFQDARLFSGLTVAETIAVALERWIQVTDPISEACRLPAVQLTEAAVRTAVTTEYFPDQFAVVPRDGDKVAAAGAALVWHAVDTLNYNVNLYHFAYALNQPTSNVLFWAVTIVEAPQETVGVRLAICSNAASVWWVNGQEVIGIYNDRQSVIDDGVSKRITLKKGPNVIRAAIVNAGGATDFCARVIDERGAPVRSLAIRLDAGPTLK
jgi:hypothetical protein